MNNKSFEKGLLDYSALILDHHTFFIERILKDLQKNKNVNINWSNKQTEQFQ